MCFRGKNKNGSPAWQAMGLEPCFRVYWINQSKLQPVIYDLDNYYFEVDKPSDKYFERKYIF
jgi:hypothetical protein